MPIMIFCLVFLFLSETSAQSNMESDLESAFQNAKKGIYWALSNIPERRARLENELIDNNRVVASVKLLKQVNGVRVEATGYHESTEISVKLYKSNELLEKEGFLKPKIQSSD